MAITALFISMPLLHAREDAEPDQEFLPGDRGADATYVYAVKEDRELLMDIYYPREGSETTYKGQRKPTLLFSFGGGFLYGDRKKPVDVIWMNEMARRGFTCVSIDYRLGLKGVKSAPGLGSVNQIDKAIHLVVEDIFSATDFILKNAEDLQIDPEQLILAGSSAGAISSLQADYELCNRTSYAGILPENFRYAGVISFSGAILSREGLLDYRKSAPAPTLLFHGTKDKVVDYKQIRFFNLGFFGSDKIAKRFKHFDYNYRILRFKGNGHEVANSEMQNMNEMEDFIYKNIMEGRKKTVDALIDNPEIEKGTNYANRKELFNE